VSSRKPKQPESDLPAPRKELVARLGDCIERLQKLIATPYAGASSLDCWPTVDELNRLATAVAHLGRAIKITKVDFEHLDGVMRHLDRRYPKLGLLAFFDGLVRKLESIPVGPVTHINQKLAAGVEPSSKKQLLAIRDLLTSLEWKVEAKAGTWKELGPLLFDLSGGQIREARKKSKPATMLDIDFAQANKMFNEAFGLAAFNRAGVGGPVVEINQRLRRPEAQEVTCTGGLTRSRPTLSLKHNRPSGTYRPHHIKSAIKQSKPPWR